MKASLQLRYRLLLPGLITICCCLFVGNGWAQSAIFTPTAEDITQLNTLFDRYEKLFKAELAALPAKNKKDYEEIYKLSWDNIKQKFDRKEIFTSAAAQQYLDAVVAEIVKANPVLKDRPFQCFFSRSGIPNASYIGEGIILFNLGLFKRLENENEAGFVLCHEIAHFILKHSENSIAGYVNTLNSDAVQQELKKIKGAEYRKREQLEKLVKGVSFDTRRHSREHESEADSMAIELMRATRFDMSGALATLALLDTIDTDTLNTVACLEKMFNAKNYPFQKKWIAREEGLLGGHARLKEEEELADSLKTHPDCKLRMKLIEPLIKRYAVNGTLPDPVDKTRFEALKNTSTYEIIEYAFTSGNYTKSMHYTLEMLQLYPSDPYLVTQVGKILNGLFAAQKSHTLGKIIDLPSPDYQPDYNLLLQFVQNLHLEDIASISYHYLDGHHPQMDFYKPFKETYSVSIQIAQK